MRALIEGQCIAVYGYEEDYLAFIEDDGRLLGITQVVSAASSPDLLTEWATKHAFENEDTPWDDAHGVEARAEYRRTTGRKYPPVLQVRLVIDVAEAPQEVTEAFWAEERAKVADIPHHTI